MLALDPFYEMFPSSYRRPYPYWEEGFGRVVNARPRYRRALSQPAASTTEPKKEAGPSPWVIVVPAIAGMLALAWLGWKLTASSY